MENSKAKRKPRSHSTKSCAVFNCPNPIDASYHFFPSNEALRQSWIDACGKLKSFNPNSSRVCSKHFTDDSFDTSTLRRDLMPQKKFIRRLKPYAMPSINLPKKPGKCVPNLEQQEKEDNSISISRLLEAPSGPSVINYSLKELKHQLKEYRQKVSGSKSELIDRLDKVKTEECAKKASIKVADFAEKNKELLQEFAKNNSLVESKDVFAKSSNQVNEPGSKTDEEKKKSKSGKCENPSCRNAILRYRKENRKLKRILRRERLGRKPNVDRLVRDALYKKGYSKSKVNFLLGKVVRPGNFTQDEIVDGLLLRTISYKAYNFLRQKKLLCLPSLTTLSSWTNKFQMDVGYLKSSFEAMKNHLLANKSKKNFDLTVLSYGEVSTSGIIESSPSLYQVLGPFKKLHVLYCSGLVHQWKKPIYLGLDQPLNKKMLLQGISEVEKNGGKVIQVVFAMRSTNMKLWADLGISKTQPFFIHPDDSEKKIFVMADPPHLLRLAKNCILTSGLRLPNGAVLGKDLSQRLIKSQAEGDFTPSDKIESLHIKSEEVDNHHVNFSEEQLLSYEVSCFIEMKWPELKEEKEFIEMISNWYAIFSSQQENDTNRFKCAYGGVHYEDQKSFLKKYIPIIENTKKSDNIPCNWSFQKGMIISSKALLLMFPYIKNLYGVEFLLTTHCNQDIINNFFSRLHQLHSSNGHLSSTEALNRIRLLMLEQQTEFATPSAPENCNNEQEGSSFISTDDEGIQTSQKSLNVNDSEGEGSKVIKFEENFYNS